MGSNKDLQRIRKIIIHCQKATDLVNRCKEYETFKTDDAFYSSISMRLMQIGEHARGLSDDFLNETKDIIPWQQIKGMRNLFAHEYDDMLPKKIWVTAINDIPILQQFCENYLKENNTEETT
jgi:uncharacterized protein with HEPN domain